MDTLVGFPAILGIVAIVLALIGVAGSNRSQRRGSEPWRDRD